MGSSSSAKCVVFGELPLLLLLLLVRFMALRVAVVETAVPMGGVDVPVLLPAAESSSESSEASSSTTTGGGRCELLLLLELLVWDDGVGMARLPPNCMGGIAGTGGMPAALSEAVLEFPALVGLLLGGDCLGEDDRGLYDEFDVFRAWPG